ncbi:ATP-binding cassette domain-containing protein [Pseudoflavonifractor sp. MCC625]|uniref:ABC transporter ATP-binding protein n=1 Tax=Pseudoflavonifractor sp. MCC625 TaxID=2592647 RepID=UPI001C02EF0F|nr:ATP-binding cassette domain-containing protein [Pseudoflavonifractor sp. MCC625]MBT9684233.1 ATP-binding cassette domain-containing protein [Pseudoflavonifractor sp. MCC625]
MDAIQTIGLCKRYGNKNAVNNLSIQVPKGSVYGFIGRNGAGKSTTQRMICGLASPTAGEIKLFERPVTDPAVRRKIGTLIEQPGIYPGMSALENVILQGYSIGLENPQKSALEALDAVGLSKAVKKKAKHLSLGMKQRLGLAIAMLGNPELLILDEPINGLDPEGIVQLREVIANLHRDRGVTIFISSHILGELSKIATHYGIIKDGELIEQTSAEELANKRKDYLTVKVEDAQKAAQLLSKELHIPAMEVVSSREIHLPGFKDTAAVNRILYSNNYNVEEVFLHQQDLEEYFIELMGGTDHE